MREHLTKQHAAHMRLQTTQEKFPTPSLHKAAIGRKSEPGHPVQQERAVPIVEKVDPATSIASLELGLCRLLQQTLVVLHSTHPKAPRIVEATKDET